MDESEGVRAAAYTDGLLPVRAASYSRNSVSVQDSIRSQMVGNRKAAEDRGWSLVAELSDGSSASRFTTKVRDDWAELLRLVPELNVVVLWEASRGDRTLSSWIGFLDLCREHGVKIHATGHGTTYDPRKPRDYRGLAEDGVDAAYESDKTSLRVSRGMATAAMGGRPAGDITYGYLRVYHPHTGKFVEQREHPQHADVVREIIRRLGKGEPVTAVANDLTARQVPAPEGPALFVAEMVRRSRRGEPSAEIAANLLKRRILAVAGGVQEATTVVDEVLARVAGVTVDREPQRVIGADLAARGVLVKVAPWNLATLLHLAVNRAYVGMRVHRAKNGEVREYPAVWPAIVTEAEHHAVVRTLSAPDRKRAWGPRPGRATSLVGNIAVCGTCGKRIAAKGPEKYRCCVNVTRPGLDDLVAEAVIAWATNPSMFQQLRQASDNDDRELVRARADIDRLTADLDMWRLSAARGNTSPASLAVIEAEISANLADAQRRAEKASTPAVVRDLLATDETDETVEEADVRRRWNDAPLGARRDLVRVLMTVTVHSSIGRGRKLTERVEIAWRDQ